jgi:uncharacterized integral membrane protein
VRFLASPLAGYISVAVIPDDGGATSSEIALHLITHAERLAYHQWADSSFTCYRLSAGLGCSQMHIWVKRLCLWSLLIFVVGTYATISLSFLIPTSYGNPGERPLSSCFSLRSCCSR